jgi:hypothetical protein
MSVGDLRLKIAENFNRRLEDELSTAADYEHEIEKLRQE